MIADELRELQAQAWQAGFNRAYEMSRMWGHVDQWEWDEPHNPYLNPYREDA